jgi:predicted nucleic acid-binding protein
LFVSQVVLDEVDAGDQRAAAKRAEFLATLPALDMPDGVADLAAALIKGVPIPSKAAADAAHIAVAAYHGIDFVLTWNLAHIANAELRRRIEAVCRACGYAAPILCTPDELMGEQA